MENSGNKQSSYSHVILTIEDWHNCPDLSFLVTDLLLCLKKKTLPYLKYVDIGKNMFRIGFSTVCTYRHPLGVDKGDSCIKKMQNPCQGYSGSFSCIKSM